MPAKARPLRKLHGVTKAMIPAAASGWAALGWFASKTFQHAQRQKYQLHAVQVRFIPAVGAELVQRRTARRLT